MPAYAAIRGNPTLPPIELMLTILPGFSLSEASVAIATMRSRFRSAMAASTANPFEMIGFVGDHDFEVRRSPLS